MLQEHTNSETAPRHGRSHADSLPIYVLLVDDHPEVRHAVRRLIADQSDMVTIAEHGTASPDTSDVASWADVAVIDYQLGDRDGLRLTQQIKRRPSPPAVLIYSAFADAPLVIAAIVAGADGLLAKTALADELSIAIRALFRGDEYFPAIPESVAVALSSRLERADQAIFSMLIHGVPPAEIGAVLGLTAAELEARRKRILFAIAPRTPRARIVDAARSPLDYERPRRRRRHPAAG